AEAPLPPAVVEELKLNTESRATYKGKTLTEPGIVDKIKARLPKALLRRNQAARLQVEQFLAEDAIKTSLPLMEVTPEQARNGEGWVTTETLVKGPNWLKLRFRSKRVILQKRAVVHTVEYLQDVDGAKVARTTSVGHDVSSTADAKREGYVELGVGPVLPAGDLLVGGGVQFIGGASKQHGQSLTNEDSSDRTQVTKEKVTLFVTKGELQVREVGKPEIIFEDAYEARRWATTSDARKAGIGPAEPDREEDGSGRSLELTGRRVPASLERAVLHHTGAGAQVAQKILAALPELPGHHRWSWRDSGFLTDPSDEKVFEQGLMRRLEQQVRQLLGMREREPMLRRKL